MEDEKIEYLTQQGFNDLEAELVKIKDELIPEIAKRIDEAKQLGDLSENAEYHAAKEDMSWTQGRLLQVSHILENAQVITKTTDDKVDLGSTIKFKTDSGRGKIYTIVGPQEADPLSGKISNESPIGQAFLGAKSGDSIEVQTPAGVAKYTIISIE